MILIHFSIFLTAHAMQNVFNLYTKSVLKIAKPIVDDLASDLTGKIVEDVLSAFSKEELLPSA